MRGSQVHVDVTAYHEAGHVVAALSEGLWVERAQVSFHEPGAGFMIHAELPPNGFDPGDGPGAAKAAWEATLTRSLSIIRVALAGPLAEAKAAGKPLRAIGALRDLETCEDVANRLAALHDHLTHYARLDPIDPSSLLNSERKQVRSWIGRAVVWAKVEHLAGYLVRYGSLNGAEIGDILGSVPTGSRQRTVGFE